MMDSKNFRIHYIPKLNIRVSFIEIFKINNFDFIRYKTNSDKKIKTNKIKYGSKYAYIKNIKVKKELIESLKNY